ncbi:hypothetical protein GDO78_019167 [Eleutherodactylus coqui]|uniref:Secreted protein n=1 Tax=Eleutherodactylus coqui TaxID=57060 RepID=A0A8J6E6G0_ELECQ|nr:hypothetical protein GDO78_019167 [Eleutherodactylus coqui]
MGVKKKIALYLHKWFFWVFFPFSSRWTRCDFSAPVIEQKNGNSECSWEQKRIQWPPCWVTHWLSPHFPPEGGAASLWGKKATKTE